MESELLRLKFEAFAFKVELTTPIVQPVVIAPERSILALPTIDISKFGKLEISALDAPLVLISSKSES